MTTKRRGILTGLVLVGYLAWLVQSADATVQYTVTDLGAVGQYIVRINEAGQVAGSTEMPDGSYQAYTWKAGQLSMLPKLVGSSYAIALNDQGQIVGQAAAGVGESDQRAVLWHNGTIQDLNSPPGPNLFVSWGINNAGQVLVRSTTSAYLLENGTLRGLGIDRGSALNEVGQVAGAKNTGQSDANGPIQHAVLWQNGAIEDLGTLGGKRSEAWGINSAGVVVGVADTAMVPGSPSVACYWDVLGIHSIPIGGTRSEAHAVNDLGQMVGIYAPESDPQYARAFVYAGGLAQDLNDLVDPASGWLLLTAWDINDAGSIVGIGLQQGQKRGFLLTPVPLPATVVLLLPGLLWIRLRTCG